MPRLGMVVGMLVVAVAAAAWCADEVPVQPARPTPVETIAVGGTLTDDVRVLPLVRADERDVPLASLGGDKTKPLVVLVWSAKCPVCRRYSAALRTLAKDYDATARIAFVFSNATESETDVRKWLDAQSFVADVAVDPNRAACTKLATVVTPTALVFDASGALRYRGPIDDDRRARGRDTVDHLRVALDAVLAGKPVENAEPRAFGSSVRATKR